ncbi:RidA family protein [Cellulomonas sp. ATA003]|uniref:RidA family protein n=1 Tax=Cellulomonas sp. ATA003 TaxID=3073064 RepID=UPI002873DB20|nr:RidA family protein [Cellulomonas sp. ATA003]WNB85886.1 RidA family protein [Cellulomonas sp. ATA003]
MPDHPGGRATGGVAARLADLGLTLPDVAAPVAAYVPAVRSGALVHTSGQLPFVDGVLPVTGKVGVGPGLVDPDRAAELARTAALNALAAVDALVGDLDAVVRVVKVTGYVASDPSFTGQPAVINGASQLLGQVLGDAGVHARSAVGVAVLPLDSPVEVEIVVEVR